MIQKQPTERKWNPYEYVTERLLRELEQGRCPWASPYLAAGAHKSLATGGEYHGLNTILLTLDANAKGYRSPWWATLHAANKLGGTVRRGEHGSKVFFFKVFVTKDEDKEDDEEEQRRRIFLRSFTVFNIEQLEGIVAPASPPPERALGAPSVEAEAIWSAYAALGGPGRREHQNGPAYYQRVEDVVSLPPRSLVKSDEAYYKMLFHEAVHSTGHDSRLKRASIRREDSAPFGSPVYSQEELVAEMGAAMLAHHAGLKVSWEDSGAYLRGWLGKLRDDKRCAVFAAKQAEKAARWILGERSEALASAPEAAGAVA